MRRALGTIVLLIVVILLFPAVFPSQIGSCERIAFDPTPPISQISSSGPMDSPWPMFKNDQGSTGLSNVNTSRNPGRLTWEFKAFGEISTPVIDTDGHIYFTSEPGYLYCIYPDGKQKWMTSINTSGFAQAPALASDGTIYVHSLDGGLYAYHANGSFKWYVDTGYYGNTPPVIGQNGNILVAARNGTGANPWNPILLSVYPNGTVYWTRDDALHDTQFVSIQPNGTILMPASHTINMYLPNGTLKNRATDDGNMSWSSATVAKNGTFYFCTYQGGLISMDDTGTESLWNGDLLSAYGITHISPSIGPDGSIYTFDMGRIKSFSSSGKPGWSFHIAPFSRSVASNPSIGNDGTLFFGKRDVGAFAVWQNGFQRWKFENMEVSNRNPAIDAYGTIYYPGWNGSLYAVGSVEPDPPILSGNGRGGKISLSWAPPEFDGGEDIKTYSVYRGPDPGNLSMLRTSSADFKSLTDIEVTPGKDHYYSVTATNRRGESEFSNIIKVVPMIRPDPPALLELNRFDYFITLSWAPPGFDGGASIENYSVYRSNDGIVFNRIGTTSHDLLSFRDNDFGPGMFYIYYVTATNSEGESSPSAMLWEDTYEVPGPPFLHNLTNHNDEFINITWSDPEFTGGPPVTEYDVQKSIDDGSFSTYITVNATTQTNTVFDPFIEPDRKYSYRIIAINSIGRSEPSNVETVILYEPPNPPRNVNVTTMDRALTIDWDHPIPRKYSSIINYNLSFQVDGEWITPLSVISKDDTSFLYNGQNGKSVLVRLWSHNEYGDSDFVEVTGTPGRAPDPPIDVTASFGMDIVSLTWAPPDNDGGYDVFRYYVHRSTDNDSYERIATVNYLTFSFIDEDVEPGVNYRYFVEAENVIGISDPSNVVSVFEPIIYNPPPAPEIYLTTKGILYIKIHWRTPEFEGPEITRFIVYREWSEGGPIQNITIDLSSNSRSYNDSDIMFDVNYTYQVAAVNEIGESQRSNIIDIRVRNLTKPPVNDTGGGKNTPNLAFIYGIIGAVIILAAAGVIYFVMTKRGPFEPPPEEFELEPEPLKSSMVTDVR